MLCSWNVNTSSPTCGVAGAGAEADLCAVSSSEWRTSTGTGERAFGILLDPDANSASGTEMSLGLFRDAGIPRVTST
eukprot:15277041-Heterocapsa_arctica.AAC.1